MIVRKSSFFQVIQTMKSGICDSPWKNSKIAVICTAGMIMKGVSCIFPIREKSLPVFILLSYIYKKNMVIHNCTLTWINQIRLLYSICVWLFFLRILWNVHEREFLMLYEKRFISQLCARSVISLTREHSFVEFQWIASVSSCTDYANTFLQSFAH